MGQAQPEDQLLRQDDGHMLAHYFVYFAMSESLHNTKLVKSKTKQKHYQSETRIPDWHYYRTHFSSLWHMDNCFHTISLGLK